MSNEKRGSWSGRLGFVLAAIGSAVGLGNIWKFPYLVGTHGGAGFIAVYIIMAIVIGFSICVAEIYIGQKSQCNALNAFARLNQSSSFARRWNIIGWIAMAATFLITSYYCMIGGWVLDFEFRALTNQFANQTPDVIHGLLQSLLASPFIMILWLFIYSILNTGVVMCGVQKGIERCSVVLMPLLFLMLVALCVRCAFLDGFVKGLEYLFVVDIDAITADSVLSAVGQVFFSLSLGMGIMITYGSYLKKEEKLPSMVVSIIVGGSSVGILAALVIFPVVATFNLEPSQGPGLMFSVLPALFAQMPGSYVVSVLFFSLVLFAALTSSVSLLESVVACLTEKTRLTRKSATLLSGVVFFILGCFCALSFNVWQSINVFGFSVNIFNAFDRAASDLLLPLSGILTSLFFGWILGKKAVDALFPNCLVMKFIMLWSCRVIAPISITWVLIAGVSSWF